jgi:hypothetical protein
MGGDKKTVANSRSINLITVIFRGFPDCSHKSNEIVMNKAGNVRINVILRRVR